MINIFFKILIRVISIAAILLIPKFLGTDTAGNIFKYTALIIFVSEISLVHLSTYLHRNFNENFHRLQKFNYDTNVIGIIFLLSVLFCAGLLFFLLHTSERNFYTILVLIFLCGLHALGRLMIVVVDESLYILFGETLPLITAIVFCIIFDKKNVELFLIYKFLASVPYIIWCLYKLPSKFLRSSNDFIYTVPRGYLKMNFTPFFLSALSLPYLNWIIFNSISSNNSVDLRLIQSLTGPINIFVSNAKSSYLRYQDKTRTTKYAFYFLFFYLVVVSPVFILSLFNGPFDIFGIKFSASIFLGFYILTVPLFFTLKYIEDIALSSYVDHRTRLAMLQFFIAVILSLIVIKNNTSALFASLILAIHTLAVIFLIRKSLK